MEDQLTIPTYIRKLGGIKKSLFGKKFDGSYRSRSYTEMDHHSF